MSVHRDTVEDARNGLRKLLGHMKKHILWTYSSSSTHTTSDAGDVSSGEGSIDETRARSAKQRLLAAWDETLLWINTEHFFRLNTAKSTKAAKKSLRNLERTRGNLELKRREARAKLEEQKKKEEALRSKVSESVSSSIADAVPVSVKSLKSSESAVSPSPSLSIETKTIPIETKTIPIETKTIPIETKTIPIETKTVPIETKTTPKLETKSTATSSTDTQTLRIETKPTATPQLETKPTATPKTKTLSIETKPTVMLTTSKQTSSIEKVQTTSRKASNFQESIYTSVRAKLTICSEKNPIQRRIRIIQVRELLWGKSLPLSSPTPMYWQCVNNRGVAFRYKPEDFSAQNRVKGKNGPVFGEIVQSFKFQGSWICVEPSKLWVRTRS